MLIKKLIRECHVWFTDPDIDFDSNAKSGYEALLSAEELSRYKRFHHASDRQRFLVSHALVRLTLSKYLDLPPREWIFTRREHGKPEIANPGVPALRFNLTHTQGLAACMISINDDCGIDAEFIKPRTAPDAVARKMFSPQEYARLLRLEGSERLTYFYRHWTLREAYVKARGIGIAFPTGKLVFDSDDNQTVSAHFDPDLGDVADDWQFTTPDLSSHHLVATAVRTGENPGKPIIPLRIRL